MVQMQVQVVELYSDNRDFLDLSGTRNGSFLQGAFVALS